MKYDCPRCSAKLKWRLVSSKPLPGERKVLPNQAVTVCPQCGVELANNQHWSEIVAGSVVALSFLAFFPVKQSVPRHWMLWFAATVLLLWAVLFAYFHFRYWRNWQRYKCFRTDVL
jgi:hypothetical protein